MAFDPDKPYELENSDGKKASGFDPDRPYKLDAPAEKTKYALAMEKIRNSNLPEWSKKDLLQSLQADEDSDTRSEKMPKWDILGDIGRSASSAFDATIDHAKASVAPYGKDENALTAPFTRLKETGMVPLSALGVLTSPLTGALHSLGGSALSYIPGMNKEKGDEAVDQAMLGLGPESMGAGDLTAQASAAASSRAAAARTAQVNSLAANAQAASNDPLLVQARKAGYVFHPADAVDKPGFVADTASGLGGKIKTQQEASTRNQQVTNRLAAADLGLSPDVTLDEATFNKVRKNADAAYDAVEKSAAKLPGGVIKADPEFVKDINGLDTAGDDLRRDFPELGENPDVGKLQLSIAKSEFSPRAGVEAIKRLRFQSKENFKALGDPGKRQLAQAQRDAANALEDLVERRLEQAGNKTAVQDYRAARQMIAKAHDIESVTDAAGNVDARKLATLGNKRPFTGNMKVIADTADRYPKSMQMPSKFGGVEKRSILDTLTSLGSGGAAIGGAWMHSPATAMAALPLAVAPLMRPIARSVALSERLQNRLAGLRAPNQLRGMIGQGAVPAINGPNYFRSLPGIGSPTPQLQPQPQGGQ